MYLKLPSSSQKNRLIATKTLLLLLLNKSVRFEFAFVVFISFFSFPLTSKNNQAIWKKSVKIPK